MATKSRTTRQREKRQAFTVPKKKTAAGSTPQHGRGAAEDNNLNRHIKELIRIGIALSTEKDINALLEMIVVEARALVHADAGTLYILDKGSRTLVFEILQNDSLGTRMGGTSGQPIDLPCVPLYQENGAPNYSNVSSYAALTGETINIPDVYEAAGFDFTGPKKYDAATGYRSKSMLVIPLQNHENTIIGILQLLNAQDPTTGEIVSFPAETVDLIASLASQAAVALTNTQLIQDLTDLFYAFIKSIATAIDEKSPYTGGHINRVVDLVMLLADKINSTGEGPFKDKHFSGDELEALRLAAWMHDVGKIITPEFVVDKSTKLQTIFDRIALIETRFFAIAQSIENHYLRQQLEWMQKRCPDDERLEALDAEMTRAVAHLQTDLDRIRTLNRPGEFMDDDAVRAIQAIAGKTYQRGGRAEPYLTADEVENLCIRKGTLTDRERAIIENHASMTMKMLDELPFPAKYQRVPEIAAGHHEKLDGSGYPLHLEASDLPLETRILVIADIFEALTARDRPYKTPMKLSQAIKILGLMVKDGHIDADIVDILVNSGCVRQYARKHMNPDQNDL